MIASAYSYRIDRLARSHHIETAAAYLTVCEDSKPARPALALR